MLSRCATGLTVLGLWAGCAMPAAAVVVFGFDTEQQLPADDRGASHQDAPQLLLTTAAPERAAAERELAQAWGAPGHWWSGQARTLPRALQSNRHELKLALDSRERPYWLQLRSAGEDCPANLAWLQDALQRKYPEAEPVPKAVARWVQARVPIKRLEIPDAQLSIASTCIDQQLIIEYRRNDRLLDAYRRSMRIRLGPDQSAQSATGRQHLRHRLRSLLLGDRSGLQQMLGLSLQVDQAVALPAGLDQSLQPRADAVSDLLIAKFMADGEHVLDSDGLGGVLRIQSRVTDPEQSYLQAFDAMLRAQLGAPAKATAHHKIHRLGAQRLILRWHQGELHLVYRDLQREEQDKERSEAQEQAQFEADTDGL